MEHTSTTWNLDAEEQGPARLFYSLDADFRFTFVSRGAAALWDWPATLLVGQVIWEVFPTAANTEGHARHLAAMRDRTTQDYQVYSPRFRRWYAFTIHPLDSGGLICFFVEIAADSAPPAPGASS